MRKLKINDNNIIAMFRRQMEHSWGRGKMFPICRAVAHGLYLHGAE